MSTKKNYIPASRTDRDTYVVSVRIRKGMLAEVDRQCKKLNISRLRFINLAINNFLLTLDE